VAELQFDDFADFLSLLGTVEFCRQVNVGLTKYEGPGDLLPLAERTTHGARRSNQVCCIFVVMSGVST
jgi:hypothetical protein